MFSEGTYSLNGWFEEYRFSHGARWTSNFTPPTAEYSPDSDTKLLLHCNGTDGSQDFPDSSGVATYYKTLAVTESSVVSLSKVSTMYRTLAVVEVSVASLFKGYFRTLSVVESSVVALGKVMTYCRNLAVVESSVVSLSRVMTYLKTLSVVESSVVTLLKKHYKTLAVTCVTIPSLIRTQTYQIVLAVVSTIKALLKSALYEPLADYVEGENCFLMEHSEDWSSIVTIVTLKGGRDASGNDIVVQVKDKEAIKQYGERLMIVSETQWTTQTLCELRALQILSDLSKPGIAVKLDCEPNVLNIDDAVVFRSTSIGVDDTFNVQSITREYGPGEGMVLELSNKPPALTDLLSTLERAIQRR